MNSGDRANNEPAAVGSPTLTERIDQLYEFERQPVTPDRYESAKHFAALFSGEHVAGTEFVIGAAFVAWGASAADVLLGLLIGNALAVLSWTFICAPIAIDTRLTLYWYLRRIAGPGVTAVYNVLNAVLFCILSGTMITVSASAIRIPFGTAPQTNWYPEDSRFVLIVLVTGAFVIWMAILGFKRLAQFSEICVPWIFVMFFAGAVGSLPILVGATPGMTSISSLADLWRIAEEQIWLHRPESGLTIWHVIAFAWICNLAFHVGLSDMAVLRYAPKVRYGFLTACGMYLGHYLAWICAGAMGAAAAIILKRPLVELDAGEVSYQVLGASGIAVVIIAGISTSNPTLYRAGLALQAVTPGWPRWLVTLLAGIVTTIVACFPFVFTQLLSFVALFGILLSPVGAIVFVEHWIFPRIGWQRYWFSATGKSVNVPAMTTWAISVSVAMGLWYTGTLHEFFVAIPLWFVSAGLYMVLAGLSGARVKRPEIESQFAVPVVESLSERTDASSAKHTASDVSPRLLQTIGIMAIVSLLVAIILPIALAVTVPSSNGALPSWYQPLLGLLSLVHLGCIAYWVLERERSAVA